MKKIILLFLLLPLLVLAGEINPKTTVKEVTVYLNGARVTTESPVNLPAGTTQVKLTGLSPLIDENSIQVSGLQNVSILSINYSVNYVAKKTDTEKLAEFEKLLADKQRELALLDNVIKGLRQEEVLINTNNKLKGDDQSLSMEQVLAFSKYYRERTTTLQTEIYDTNIKMAALTKDITALTGEIGKLKGGNSEKRGEILLKLDSATPAAITLVAKYNVTNAGWFALYDIKTTGIGKPLDVYYNAHVYQNTGEDWSDVKVTLSTGDPGANSLKPDVYPHFLNFVAGYNKGVAAQSYNYKYNPMIKTVKGQVVGDDGFPLPGASVTEEGTGNTVATDMDGYYTIAITKGKQLNYSYIGQQSQSLPIYAQQMNVKLNADATQLDEVVVVGYGTNRSDDYEYTPEEKYEEPEPEPELTATGDEKKKGMAHTSFKIARAYSIPSKEEVTVIAIDKFAIPAEYEYFAAPIINENVFLTAKIKNWEQYDILPGEANVYFEGNYAGKTFIDPNKTSEDLTISLGADANIIATREEIINKKAKSFMGTTRIMNKNFEVTIKNNKAADINLVITDRIPVSQNKEIKVDDVETGGADYDTKKGLLTWKVNLKSKESVKKALAYMVKYPRTRRVNIDQ